MIEYKKIIRLVNAAEVRMIDIKTLTSIEQIILDEGNTLTIPGFL